MVHVQNCPDPKVSFRYGQHHSVPSVTALLISSRKLLETMSREVTVNYVDAKGFDFVPDPKQRKELQAMAKEPTNLQQSIMSHMCTVWARNRLQEGDRLSIEYDGVRVGTAEMLVVPGTEPRLHMVITSGASKEVGIRMQIVDKFDH